MKYGQLYVVRYDISSSLWVMGAARPMPLSMSEVVKAGISVTNGCVVTIGGELLPVLLFWRRA